MGDYVLLYITILTYIAENLYLFTLYSVNYKIPCILFILKLNSISVKLLNILLRMLWRSTPPCKNILSHYTVSIAWTSVSRMIRFIPLCSRSPITNHSSVLNLKSYNDDIKKTYVINK